MREIDFGLNRYTEGPNSSDAFGSIKLKSWEYDTRSNSGVRSSHLFVARMSPVDLTNDMPQFGLFNDKRIEKNLRELFQPIRIPCIINSKGQTTSALYQFGYESPEEEVFSTRRSKAAAAEIPDSGMHLDAFHLLARRFAPKAVQDFKSDIVTTVKNDGSEPHYYTYQMTISPDNQLDMFVLGDLRMRAALAGMQEQSAPVVRPLRTTTMEPLRGSEIGERQVDEVFVSLSYLPFKN